MFNYKQHKIISAVPLAEIKGYLYELGATTASECEYMYSGLAITITEYDGDMYPDLGIPRHTIAVQGESSAAEQFLTAYRFRFLSAGG